MKILVTIVPTILVAAVAAFGARSLAKPARAGLEHEAPAVERARAAELRAALEGLRQENRRLAAALEQRADTLMAAPVPGNELGESEIAAALARWQAAHPPAEPGAHGATRAPVALKPGEVDLASIPMLELVRALSATGFDNVERQEIFQALRENGRIDEYVATMEKLAAEDPQNVELQIALGHAYLQKLFGVGNSPEAGPLAYKSDAAFDRALALDDENWSARFSKAVSLSNWPAFLGRGPEAIENFETLLEQQATQPPRPEFAMTYLFLGNMQQAAGERDKALATWRAGLALFPDREELKNAVGLAETQGDTSRPRR